MSLKFGVSCLIPLGLVVRSIAESDNTICVVAGLAGDEAACPVCGEVSDRVHSRYVRQVSDLPAGGKYVRLQIVARRFFCAVAWCQRQIFAERFDDDVLAERSRRTSRLDYIVHHLGLALGGRPAANFAKRLMIPVSNDTLIRMVRRRSATPDDGLHVAGIDDWAFRRNHRYGTIVCDLERRRIVKLLPDRDVATVAAFLAEHPDIEVVSRDRGGGYGEATATALPSAIQVADRWHLMENASAAFLEAVRKSMRAIRAAIGATAINPDLLSCAERLQYQSYLRREEANAIINKLATDGIAIKEIVRRTGHSRGTVRQIVRGLRTEVFRARQSSIEQYFPLLDELWASGQRNGAELWRQLRRRGFHGSLRVIGEWATRRRRAEQASDQQLQRVPSARTIARQMTTARDHLGRADAVTVAAIETAVPALLEARNLIDRFHAMIRKKVDADIEQWIIDARSSLIASFAKGILKDKAAVSAAIAEPWSNGQVEGQITKLKLVKRQMYGRGKIDLLEARLIGAA